MLESLTVYSKGGLVLYQYRSDPSLVKADDSASHTRSAINSVQALVTTKSQQPHSSAKTEKGGIDDNRSSSSSSSNNNNSNTTGFHIKDGLTFVWKEAAASCASSSPSSSTEHQLEWIVMALYPDILFEGPRAYLRNWAENLVNRTCDEYETHWRTYCDGLDRGAPASAFRPDPDAFDKTFKGLLHESKTAKQETAAQAPAKPVKDASASVPPPVSRKDGGKKEQRHWIGAAKVNDKTISELDQSNPDERSPTAESEEHRLQEARQQYLPTQDEIAQDEKASSSALATPDSSWWGSTMTNLWQNLSMNKVLSRDDLAQPMERMRQLLMEKNVASSIAAKLCSTVENELVGKKLNSLYRVQTAVQQGVEKAIHNVLESSLHVDLLRQVLTKKESGSGWFGGGKKRRPYVICVLGINGIGKTTTVAKLAYYFQSHGCKVLLVAGDTFRSGAVEQLKTHAQCLECDIYAQGYSKDPAAVAMAALDHANQPAQPQYDVVLIDTAGRMQNNAPLMAALTKLVQTVPMDSILLVAEALVGHDALSQYEMFHRAVRRVDGLILTKYDTVGTKVGAALTLTHETSTPIVFLGTGQKYHHLQSLNVNSVVASLFAS